MAIDFSALQQYVQNLTLIVEGITADYVTMKAQITALQEALAANDPTVIQTTINALAATLKVSQDRLVALDESVAPTPPTLV
jgi:hypothetical protein